MGTQIHIKVQDLLNAGWTLSITEDVTYEWDDELEQEREVPWNYLTIQKGEFIFHSYFHNIFVADCNDWGSNKERLQKAGLLDIPHALS